MLNGDNILEIPAFYAVDKTRNRWYIKDEVGVYTEYSLD